MTTATTPTASLNPAGPRPSLLRGRGLPQHVEPRCTIGLLTWNAGDEAFACVRSLLDQTEAPLEIIWIDNASTDGTPDRLHRSFSRLPTPFIQARNIGFCAAHNQAIAACRTPYYLALNQDVTLSPDYIERLCDWMDEDPRLALAGGLVMRLVEDQASEHTPSKRALVNSAGLVFPRVRFPFQIGMDLPLTGAEFAGRRIVPGVDGSMMLLRVAACREASLPEDQVFPDEFFAYHEEVDLALRLARAGWRCGVDGSVKGLHASHSSGGILRDDIYAGYLLNHWMLTLRHDSLGIMLRELPWLLRGELGWWFPRYLRRPRAFFSALRRLPGRACAARRFYRQFERKFGDTSQRLTANRAAALAELRNVRLLADDLARPIGRDGG